MHISKRMVVAVATVVGAAACGEAPVSSHLDAAGDGIPGIRTVVLKAGSTFPGDRVRTNYAANIRNGPAYNATFLGAQPQGSEGTVLAGPVTDTSGDGLTRWQINFDNGPDGWAADPYLEMVSTDPAVASVSLAPATVNTAIGDTVRLVATVRDTAGREVTGVAVSWSSSNAAAASVSSTGLITSTGNGSATITATSRGKSGTASVAAAKFALGGRVQPSGGVNVRATAAASGALLGAQPDSVAGVVVGGPVRDVAGDGLVRWQVNFDTGPDGWAAEDYLARSSRPLPPAGPAAVTVSPDTGTVLAGNTLQLTAVARDAAGSTLPGATMGFVSLDTTKAKVAASGLVTGVAAGAAFIVATSGAAADTARLVIMEPHKGWYVSPTGASSANGTRNNPWDLKTALAGAGGRITPGDTVWLRGGVYRGAFSNTVSGRSGDPIVYRQYPGERAIIDGAGTASSVSVLRVGGAWTVFWGFEITNSDPVRYSTSLANNVRPNVVANYANNTKYINLVVHDGGVAFYNETNYSNVEITGCIIYNNGWEAPDRGHGHALYLKSTAGPVVARDNIIFNQFGWGVHVYTNAGQGYLNNIQLDGNVSFNNGTLSTIGTSANILLGGGGTATGDVVRNNLTYYSPGAGGTNVRIGMGTVANGTVQLQNNYFVGGSTVLDVGFWSSVTLSGNTFVGTGNVVTLNDPSTSGQTWSMNTHQRDPLATAWRWSGSGYNFATWKTRSLAGLGDLVLGGTPLANKVVVQPSGYEQGRGHVTVYNWTRAGAVTVDLGGILNPGDRYEVRNVQDLFGAPVASGTYHGAVTLPMDGVAPPAPVGFTTSRAPKTGPNFDVFVVTKV